MQNFTKHLLWDGGVIIRGVVWSYALAFSNCVPYYLFLPLFFKKWVLLFIMALDHMWRIFLVGAKKQESEYFWIEKYHLISKRIMYIEIQYPCVRNTFFFLLKLIDCVMCNLVKCTNSIFNIRDNHKWVIVQRFNIDF